MSFDEFSTSSIEFSGKFKIDWMSLGKLIEYF